MIKFTANLSVLFTEVDLIDRFKAAKKAGFNAVEIQFPYSLSAEKIKQQLIENDLQLILFNIDAGDLLQGGEGLAAVPEREEIFIKALEQCKTYAEILEPKAINVLSGRCNNPHKQSAYLSTFKKNVVLALDTFSPLGIKTVFEGINTIDMPHFIIHSGQQMLSIMYEINHPMLLMQYDIYHMEMMKENTGEFIKQHATKIGHIQFADAPGRGQPGTGKINFKALFSIIEESAYKGWVGAEYNPKIETKSSLQWLN